MAAILNSLLAALPRKAYQQMRSGLSPATLIFGDVLYQAGDIIEDVYFPSECLVSLLTPVDDHLALEVGMVGREGMVGVPLALGIGVSSVRALVQGGGPAQKMSAARFRKELHNNPALQKELNLYVHTLMAQISQTAACNRFHVVEAQCALAADDPRSRARRIR
jgi:hypothetical protein